MRPFRFAVTASWAPSAAAWAATARRAEELGYSALLMPDHLGRQLSLFVALTAAAMATTRLRVGAFVFANDYRHPLVLAREAATLDFLSGGRRSRRWRPRRAAYAARCPACKRANDAFTKAGNELFRAQIRAALMTW